VTAILLVGTFCLTCVCCQLGFAGIHMYQSWPSCGINCAPWNAFMLSGVMWYLLLFI